MKPIVSIILNQNTNSINQNPTGQVTLVENPFVMLTLPFMPSAATFNILVVVGGLSTFEKYSIRLTLAHEEYLDDLLFDTGESSIGPLGSQGMIELDNLNMDIKATNIPIKKEGVHIVKLEINGQEFKQEMLVAHRPIKKDESKL